MWWPWSFLLFVFLRRGALDIGVRDLRLRQHALELLKLRIRDERDVRREGVILQRTDEVRGLLRRSVARHAAGEDAGLVERLHRGVGEGGIGVVAGEGVLR